MAKAKAISLRFPIGGVVRRHAFQTQPPFTTVDAMNIWPTDWTEGRERGGTRPGLTNQATLTPEVNPFNWCEATYIVSNGATKRGVAMVGTNGAWLFDGTTWTHVHNEPYPSFSDATVFRNYLYVARAGLDPLRIDLLDNGVEKADEENEWLISVYSDGTTKKGVIPKKCGITQTWMSRLWFAGDSENPNVLYASAVNDTTDFHYSAPGRGSAYTSTGDSGGTINEPITSLVDHGNNCMMVGCIDSSYILRDNPRGGGYTVSISKHVGPLMQSAWCKDENHRTWYLSRRGLHMIPAGCGQPPESVGSQVIPDELVGIDPGSGAWASVGYDLRWNGLHIYVRSGPQGDRFWFFDFQSGGFWPMSFADNAPKLAVPLKTELSRTKSALCGISNTGVVSQFDRDSTEKIHSHYWYGPIQLGGPMEKGGVLSISATLDAPGAAAGATLGATEGQVMYDVHLGRSAMEAYQSVPVYTGCWDINGWNFPTYPRRSGQAAWIRVYDVGDNPISLEEVTVERIAAGMRRSA